MKTYHKTSMKQHSIQERDNISLFAKAFHTETDELLETIKTLLAENQPEVALEQFYNDFDQENVTAEQISEISVTQLQFLGKICQVSRSFSNSSWNSTSTNLMQLMVRHPKFFEADPLCTIDFNQLTEFEAAAISRSVATELLVHSKDQEYIDSISKSEKTFQFLLTLITIAPHEFRMILPADSSPYNEKATSYYKLLYNLFKAYKGKVTNDFEKIVGEAQQSFAETFWHDCAFTILDVCYIIAIVSLGSIASIALFKSMPFLGIVAAGLAGYLGTREIAETACSIDSRWEHRNYDYFLIDNPKVELLFSATISASSTINYSKLNAIKRELSQIERALETIEHQLPLSDIHKKITQQTSRPLLMDGPQLQMPMPIQSNVRKKPYSKSS